MSDPHGQGYNRMGCQLHINMQDKVEIQNLSPVFMIIGPLWHTERRASTEGATRALVLSLLPCAADKHIILYQDEARLVSSRAKLAAKERRVQELDLLEQRRSKDSREATRLLMKGTGSVSLDLRRRGTCWQIIC